MIVKRFLSLACYGAWILCSIVAPASATTMYSDGLTHTANGSGPFDDVLISQASTLNVVTGGNIVGASDAVALLALTGVSARSSANINVFDGAIHGGGSQTGFAGIGIASREGVVVNVSGGLVQGGDGVNGGAGISSSAGAGAVTISGGLVHGGNASGGFGGGGIQSDGNIKVTGGTVRGGDAVTGLGGPGIYSSGGLVALFAGLVQGGLERDGMDIAGGSFTLSGGTILGGDGYPAGPRGNGLVMSGSSTGIISGGLISQSAIGFDGWPILVEDSAWLDIKGGNISGTIRIAGDAVVRVFGTHLKYRGNVLTGTLTDGTPINSKIVGSEHGILLFAPEPSTFALAALGLSVLGGATRVRRKRAYRSATM